MSAAIEEFIPHRAPMRFIDALAGCTDTTASATANFCPGHFAIADGAVLESALVECVAQTVAAAMGQRAKDRGQASSAANGMLIAVTNFQIQTRPRAETELRIEIRELKRLGPMLMISSQIFCEGKTIASGELTVYA